jgi:flavorubredoxin
MRKVCIIYDSQTGFTENMATAILEGVAKVTKVEGELRKIGDAFSISSLNEVDAIIFGSPTIYGNVSLSMKFFLECVIAHTEAKRLKLSGKLGGVFGSYEWDGGRIIEQLGVTLESLGMTIVTSGVSLADGRYEKTLTEQSKNKCRNFGRIIAEKAVAR